MRGGWIKLNRWEKKEKCGKFRIGDGNTGKSSAAPEFGLIGWV